MSGPAPTPVRLLDDGLPGPEDVAGASTWSAADRQRLEELLEDARSQLQRDLILRAVDAGHGVRPVHGFADTIRPMEDPALYTACCGLTASHGAGARLEVLLRAQMDPIFALALRQGRAWEARRTPGMGLVAPVLPPAKATVKQEPGESPGRRAGPEARRTPPAQVVDLGGRTPGPGFAEDLFNAAAEFAGVRFRERPIDDAALTLAQAVAGAAQALARGLLVPVVLGSRPGDHRRYALMLQLHVSGRTRAFQLHDPFAQEVVWVNEADLLAGKELPFSDKVLRRLTAIALPTLTPGGAGAMQSGFD